MIALLEIARIYKARKLFADLQRPTCYKDPQNKGINLIVYSLFTLWPKFGNHWISRIGSLRFWWNSVQRKALVSTICSREKMNILYDFYEKILLRAKDVIT